MLQSDKGNNPAAQGGIGIGILSITPKDEKVSVGVVSGQPNSTDRGQEGTMRSGKTS